MHEQATSTSSLLQQSEVHQQETLDIPPSPGEVFDNLVQAETVEARKQWLEDKLAGEYDVSLAHVDRLMARHDALTDESYAAWDSGEADRYRALKMLAEQRKDKVFKIFGEAAYKEHARCVRAKNQLSKPEYPTMEYWGNEATDLARILTEEDLANIPEQKTTLNRTALLEVSPDKVIEALNGKHFIEMGRLQARVKKGVPKVALLLDEPMDVPLEQMISAGGFSSWAGRSGGRGAKSFTTAEGQEGAGRSVDAIIDYAARETDLPPVDLVTAYVQPNGEVVYGVGNDNHRVAAGILRGDTSIKAKSIEVVHLEQNIEDFMPHQDVQQQNIPEQLGISEKMPEWNKFVELTETMGLAGLNNRDRLEWLKKHSSVHELIAFAALTHSFLAPNAQQAPVDFAMSMSSGETLMDPDQRYQAFIDAAKAIEDVLSIPAETDEEISAALARSANIVAYTMLVAHPFEDGNGRTARVLSHTLREGLDPANDQDVEDLKTLGTNRPKKGFRIYSYIPHKREGKSFKDELSVLAGTNVPFDKRQHYEHSIEPVMFVPPFYE